ncbi:MAG TPA: hypothetical protein VI454_20825 [Verrucomicrobiae bacterium]|jgi:hypothetical protein
MSLHNFVRPLFLATLLGLSISSRLGPTARADELVTISKQKLDELTAKAHEAGRLAAEVVDLKARIKQLEQQLSPGAISATTVPSPGSRAAPAPAVVVAALPLPAVEQWSPLDPKAAVTMQDLLAHYGANPAAADARYKGKFLRFRGMISGFDKPLFVSHYHVQFRQAGLATAATARISPPPQYKRVYVTTDGQKLMGEASGFLPVPLAQAGTEVVVEGKCSGFRNGSVSIVEADFVRDSSPSGK